MQLRTVIIPRVKKKPKTRIERLLVAFFLVLELLWNKLSFFIVGFYYALSKEIILLLIMFIFLFIHLSIDYNDGEVAFKIIRAG